MPVIERNPPEVTRMNICNPIDVYLSGGDKCRNAAYIWSATDALRLRNEFRILGDFLGTLPKHPAQNTFLTMPLVLNYEELHLGVTRGFLRVLRDDSKLDYVVPTADDVRRYYEQREKDREKFADEAIANQEQQRKKRMENGFDTKQKVKKKMKKLEQQNKISLDNPNEERLIGRKRKRPETEIHTTENERVDDEPPAKIARTDGFFGRVVGKVWNVLSNLFPRLTKKEVDVKEKVDGVVIEKVSSDDEEEEKEPSSEDIEKHAAVVLERRREQAKQAAVLETPCEAFERSNSEKVISEVVPKDVSPERVIARQIVFADLYDKGYTMSCGAKFGADYLAYAGDSQLFHASLAVIVMNSSETVSMHDVIALGRLGDSTKKRISLAYVHGDPKGEYEVRYVGVQWEETLP